MVNVSEQRFDYNWNMAIKHHKGSKGPLLVQNYLEGFEARATVIEGELVSIVLRVPPYVIGNGKDSIDKLIDDKNIERSKCGYLSTVSIKKTLVS